MFQRKSPAKRSAKSYQEDTTEKKTRTIKRGIVKEGNGKSLAETSFSAEAIYQKIQERAYRIFEQRGYSHGNDVTDWLQAEKEIIAEITGNKSSLN